MIEKSQSSSMSMCSLTPEAVQERAGRVGVARPAATAAASRRLPGSLDVVLAGVGDDRELGQVVLVVEQDVELDAALGSPVRRSPGCRSYTRGRSALPRPGVAAPASRLFSTGPRGAECERWTLLPEPTLAYFNFARSGNEPGAVASDGRLPSPRASIRPRVRTPWRWMSRGSRRVAGPDPRGGRRGRRSVFPRLRARRERFQRLPRRLRRTVSTRGCQRRRLRAAACCCPSADFSRLRTRARTPRSRTAEPRRRGPPRAGIADGRWPRYR
jgi:hypothetical protein